MPCCSEVGEVIHSLTLIGRSCCSVVVIKSGGPSKLVAGHSLALATLHHSVRAGRLNARCPMHRLRVRRGGVDHIGNG